MQADTRRSGVEDAGFAGIVGASAWTSSIRAEVLAVAACPSNVLVTGPTGTGKEVIARAIHAHSPRAGKPFIPVDCAAITGTLFASLIFGHLKGAFTGATYNALGAFRAAHGGTVFLDEIGDLEPEMQIKLLRVLQHRIVTPLGSHQGIPVDVRVIAATNRDLEQEVAAGRFREDLYYRLNVVSLRTTPLRERPEDIEPLAKHFLNKLAITHGLTLKRVSDEALERLRREDWPGNVRQLENVLERAAFLGCGHVIGVEQVCTRHRAPAPLRVDSPACVILPILRSEGPAEGPRVERDVGDCCMAADAGRWRTMEEVEREYIRRTLALTSFNQSAAARLLGMERHQLVRKIRKYGLDLICPYGERALKPAA
jgi:DNA-binding NtrC family response regulator